MDCVKTYIEYLEKELKDAERAIKLMKDYFKPCEVVNNSCQRALGALYCLLQLDSSLSYETMANIYDDFREKVEKMA